MKLTNKILLAFAMTLSVFVILLVVGYFVTAQMIDTRRLTVSTYMILDRADSAIGDLYGIETAERGFAITGKEVFLEPLEPRMKSFEENLNALESLLEDKPNQKAVLGDIREQYGQWLEISIKQAISLRRQVNAGAQPLQAVIDHVSSETGKQQMDEMMQDFSILTRDEFALLNERQASLSGLTKLTNHLIIYGGLAGILLGIIVSLLIAANLKRPLRHAVAFAEKVKAGDYSARLDLKRTDEIGTFLSALQAMVEQLAGNIEKLKDQSLLLDLANDAIIVRDVEGKIVFWNKGAEKTYGWSKEESLGRTVGEILQTQFPKPVEEIIQEVIDTGSWIGELRHVKRDGGVIIVASHWAAKKDREGNPTGFLEINRDITDHKEADIQISTYMKKLESSNTVLQDFAFVASHDLREPLRKIAMFSDMLQTIYAKPLEGEGTEYLEKIQKAASRMQELIDSLLVYSRVTTKGAPFEPVDIGKVVEEVLGDLEISIHETEATVQVDDLPTIEADRNQMLQLFQNLIGNSLKFHKEGEKPFVRVYSRPCWGQKCRIFVEDDGIGFDEKYLGLIFQPFQRLHGRSSIYAGSGMGLTISRKIIERHNGEITARSEPGRGSTFIITLPEKQVEEPALLPSAA